MLDLRRLRHALVLAQHRNFARAAAELRITQSALSRSIQALEETTGVLLFDRSPRDVSPTAFGELVLKHARSLELSAIDLQRDLQLAKGMEIGQLVIGAGPNGAAAMVGKAVGQMTSLYPNLRIKVVVRPWLELPAHLHAREIDLMVSDVGNVTEREDLEITPLLPHQDFVVCRAEHPLTKISKVAVSQALQFPLAGPNLLAQASDALLRQMQPAAREYALKHGLLTVTCDSSAVLKDILSNSDAISVMSLFVVIRELQSGELTIIRDLDLGVGAKFGITHLRSRSLSAPAGAFIKVLVDLDRMYSEMEQSFLEFHSIAGP